MHQYYKHTCLIKLTSFCWKKKELRYDYLKLFSFEQDIMNTFLKDSRTWHFKYELEAIIVRCLLPQFTYPQVPNIGFVNQPEIVQGKLHYRVNTIIHVNNIVNTRILVLKVLLKKNPIIITAIWEQLSAPVLGYCFLSSQQNNREPFRTPNPFEKTCHYQANGKRSLHCGGSQIQN